MRAGRIRALLRPLARRFVYPAVEGVWTALFYVAGRILRPSARAWKPAGGESVLVVAPHPDDETLACGGVIALHARAGDKVHIAIVTDGGKSRARNLSRERIVSLRRREAEEAIGQLGPVRLTQLGLPEGRWSQRELRARLAALLRDVQPQVIYAPSCVDFHPEHVRVASGLAGALSEVGVELKCKAVRVYQLQVPLTPMLVNLVASIKSTAGQKRQALRAYRTQLPAFAWLPRLVRHESTLYGFSGPVEVFWELPPGVYSKLVLSQESLGAGYRGLRPRPLSDGLAWLVGLRGRWRLRRAAGIDVG